MTSVCPDDGYLLIDVPDGTTGQSVKLCPVCGTKYQEGNA